MPVITNRISRAQDNDVKSLTKRRSRPSKRSNALISKKTNINVLQPFKIRQS